jgi:heme exporter protein D
VRLFSSLITWLFFYFSSLALANLLTKKQEEKKNKIKRITRERKREREKGTCESRRREKERPG